VHLSLDRSFRSLTPDREPFGRKGNDLSAVPTH
jgi:hypothetical protein